MILVMLQLDSAPRVRLSRISLIEDDELQPLDTRFARRSLLAPSRIADYDMGGLWLQSTPYIRGTLAVKPSFLSVYGVL